MNMQVPYKNLQTKGLLLGRSVLRMSILHIDIKDLQIYFLKTAYAHILPEILLYVTGYIFFSFKTTTFIYNSTLKLDQSVTKPRPVNKALLGICPHQPLAKDGFSGALPAMQKGQSHRTQSNTCISLFDFKKKNHLPASEAGYFFFPHI